MACKLLKWIILGKVDQLAKHTTATIELVPHARLTDPSDLFRSFNKFQFRKKYDTDEDVIAATDEYFEKTLIGMESRTRK